MNAIAYNSSKGAVIGLTMDLAVKWVPYNINVNVVAPGFMISGMTQKTIEKNNDKIIT